MSLGRAVATVGGFTLLSRVVGFIRDVVLSAVLGSGAVADAFFVAFKLPNFFSRLFAEGAFSAAFVPLFSRELQDHGRAEALAFARQAHAALLVVLVPFSIVLMLGMPWVLAHFTYLTFGILLFHSELVRFQPSAGQLTRFYLAIAAGGGGKPETRPGNAYYCFALPKAKPE